MSTVLDSHSPSSGRSFLDRPAFKAHLHVEVLGDDALLCLGSGRHTVLSGRPYALVAPLIDGRRSSDDIVELLAGQLPPSEAYHALLMLQRNGLTQEASDVASPVAAFWSALDCEPAALCHSLVNKSVAVTALGEVPLRSFEERLGNLDVRLGALETADLWVALADDYLQPGLEELNRRALSKGRPWLLVRPNGRFILVGPIFHPPASGCWSCLAQRLRGNRELELYAQRVKGHATPYPERGMLPSTLDIALGMAATEVAKWLVTGRSSDTVLGKIVSLDTLTYHTEDHTLVRRPQCPDCGDADCRPDRPPVPVDIRSIPKASVADGGHRAIAPEEALRRYRHHVSPITGVVKGLTRITTADDPLHHVYVSSNNMAARYDSLQRLRRNLRGSCCGKGVTDAQAQVSAMFEAIERYSGVFRGEDEIRILASRHDLGEAAVDPLECMLYSDAQYRDRERWNAQEQRLDWVPLPFDESAKIEWTPLWSLTRQEFRHLPTGYLYYSYPGAMDQAYFLPHSNGAAAGTTVEDAILQGFLEVVERDAVALWWYNRLSRPAVDLDSFDDPFVQSMKQSYRAAQRELWILDLTSDLGVPVFIAVSRRFDRAVEDIIFAPAAHFDARIGIIRALTELNQMLPGVANSTPDGRNYDFNDPVAIEWWRTATAENQPWLRPSDSLPPTRKGDHPDRRTADLKEDVELCQSTVERIGLEMLVLDQTRLDIGVPVVKVVVPGLRHFWARYAPGRLYDVPVSMGWLTAPLKEEELNPIEVFI